MNDGKVTLNRPLVGIIALACLAASAWLYFNGSFSSDNENFVTGAGIGAAFFRVGLLMSALWLALPPKGREASWAKVTPGTFVGLLLSVYLVIRMKWLAIPLLIAVATIGVILRPRTKYRPPRG